MAVTAYLPRVFNSTTPASNPRHVSDELGCTCVRYPCPCYETRPCEQFGARTCSTQAALSSFELF